MTAQAIVDRVKLNSAEQTGDGLWIRLIPAGVFSGRDKRGPYKNVDADQIIAATEADNLEAGLPIDYNHATFKPGSGGEAPAAGWITKLANRNSEVWGRVEWNDTGKTAMKDKQYRYISPAFMYGPDGTVKKLLNAALTNNPNLYYTAICSREDTSMSRTAVKPTKEQKDKLALNSSVDDAWKIINKASQDAGVPPHAFLAALADKSVETADGGDDPNADPNADETPEEKAAREAGGDGGDGGGDTETNLNAEMSALQAREAELCNETASMNGNGDGSSASEAAETEFTNRATKASQAAEKAGQAEMAADFMSMVRASQQRVQARKTVESPEQLEQMAAAARAAGRNTDALAFTSLALMRRNMTENSNNKVGLTAEQVNTMVDSAVAKHTKPLQERLDGALGDQKRNAAVAYVENAIRERRLTPAERDDYIALHTQDSATCEKIVAKRPVINIADVPFESRVQDGDKVATMSRAETTICTMLGVKPQDFVKAREHPVEQLSIGVRN